LLHVLGAINDAELRTGNPPGMERAIPKSKGQEFGSLLHQLGAEFTANPFSPQLREFLLTIAPDAKERFPKRTPKKVEPPAPPPEPAGKKKGAHAAPRAAAGAEKHAAEKHAADKHATEKHGAEKHGAEKHKEKPLPAAKKGPLGAKKGSEAARHADASKKKLVSAKSKHGPKSLAKRKPR